jgi:hypothetical protein
MKALFYNGTSFHKFSAASDKRLYVNCVFSPAVSRHGRCYIIGFCGCISASGRTRTFQDQFGAFVFSSRNPVCPVKQGKKELLDEKNLIEEMLKTTGYDAENKAAARRRGRTVKQEVSSAVQEPESPAAAISEA